MTGLLIKKQITEIFRTYFYDEKKNKARSKLSTALFILMFIVIMVGLLGGIFSFLSFKLCEPLVGFNVGWLYFAIMGVIAILLGSFGSIFNTFSGLYLSKDNDLLFSLPIEPKKIIISRLFTVYLMGLMYSAVVIVPAVIIYWIKAPISIAAILGGILLILFISIFVLIVSCALGYIVAIINQKLKYKSFMIVIASIVFIAAYYFVYFKAQQIIMELLQHAVFYGEQVKNKAYPVYLFGRVGEGDLVAILTVGVIVIALLALTYKIISRSFIDISTNVGETKKVEYKETVIKPKGVFGAVLSKEFNRFTSSPNYMLNCGLGILIMPIAAAVLLFKGEAFVELITGVFGTEQGILQVLLSLIICMMASMNDMAAPSISLEGKNLWILKSLPVDTWEILKAKISVQVILTEIPVILCIIVSCIILPGTFIEKILVALVPLVYVVMSALFNLILGISSPNLSWTNEIYPLKQSLAVTIALIGGWIYAGLGIILYIWKLYNIGCILYLSIVLALEVVLSAVFYYWLRNKGTKIFEEL